MGASQDGNRENIILIATICADGSRISLTVIYQSESGLIQDTWLDDLDENGEITYFTATQKGWTNENIGLYWLKHIFDRYTKAKTDNYRRLFIVDGHNSHVNMRFINYYDQNHILLIILPPHLTHRLQPLDVGLFRPLAQYYIQQLDRFMIKT
jgi:DDE superfamily endonuclease